MPSLRFLRRITPSTVKASAALLALFLLPGTGRAQLGNIEGVKSGLPEIKIKEAIINVTPKTRFYLPSGAFDLSLRQEYKKFSVDFASFYDFVDNFMGFTIDFTQNLSSPLDIGLNMKDKVDFNEVLSNTRYIQRSQSLEPYTQYDIGRSTKLRAGLRLEKTYTTAISNNQPVDSGRNVLGEAGVIRNTVKELSPFPEGEYLSLLLQNSYGNLGSDYSYSQAEANVREFFHLFGESYIEYDLQASYPFNDGIRPLSSFYTLGGYRMLRGYSFKEFRGDTIFYNSFTFNFPIEKTRVESEENRMFSFVTWDVFTEIAKIGNRSIYSTFADTKCNIGSGIGYRILLFRNFPVQIELSLAKAFDDRPPHFYFTISSIYYTWQS